MEDGQKVISVAHSEHSSDELKRKTLMCILYIGCIRSNVFSMSTEAKKMNDVSYVTLDVDGKNQTLVNNGVSTER